MDNNPPHKGVPAENIIGFAALGMSRRVENNALHPHRIVNHCPNGP